MINPRNCNYQIKTGNGFDPKEGLKAMKSLPISAAQSIIITAGTAVKVMKFNRGDIILGATVYSITADATATFSLGWDILIDGTAADTTALLSAEDVAAPGVDVGTAVHEICSNDGWVTADMANGDTWTGIVVVDYIPGIAK